jgi:hypothetical protein
MTYWDIDPMDIDPDTGRPYSNYSSPSLDTSFHDHEMDVDEPEPTVEEQLLAALKEVRSEISRINRTAGATTFNPAATAVLDAEIERLENGGEAADALSEALARAGK